MADRIAAHRLRRGDEWTTIEEPLQLAAAIERAAGEGTAILVDCLSLWLSNLIEAGRQVDEESAALCGALASVAVPVVIVSNEVGSGIIPANALARRYADALGTLNQSVAASVGRVVFMAAGPAAGRQTIATPGDKTLNVPANVPANAERIPATIVTGFLGAGKTTLIRSLIEKARGRRIAILVNEFGEAGFDGSLLADCGDADCKPDTIVELANGCICCTVADEFLPTMEALLARDPAPDHIIIETSGLALPQPTCSRLLVAERQASRHRRWCRHRG